MLYVPRRIPLRSGFVFLTVPAIVSALSTASAQAVRPGHPRVWVTAARLNRMRAASSRNTARWQRTKQLAEQLGIPLATLDERQQIDIAIDGADEIDPQLNLIKGGGGALLREKIIASASSRFIVVADSAKQVARLGKFPLPVEVIPFAQALIRSRIAALGAQVSLRGYAYGNPYVTAPTLSWLAWADATVRRSLLALSRTLRTRAQLGCFVG